MKSVDQIKVYNVISLALFSIEEVSHHLHSDRKKELFDREIVTPLKHALDVIRDSGDTESLYVEKAKVILMEGSAYIHELLPGFDPDFINMVVFALDDAKNKWLGGLHDLAMLDRGFSI